MPIYIVKNNGNPVLEPWVGNCPKKYNAILGQLARNEPLTYDNCEGLELNDRERAKVKEDAQWYAQTLK